MTNSPQHGDQQCPQCGFRYQCVCHLWPSIDSSLSIVLISHPNELARSTNTGKLLQHSLANCRTFIWDRKQPDSELLACLHESPKIPLVLFPSDDSIELDRVISKHSQTDIYDKYQFVILDSTWQEAAKMMRKSPWLNKLAKVHLSSTQLSRYSLRRNQQPGHLCTCEVGIELLSLFQDGQNANTLCDFFQHYLSVFKADKSGHRYLPPTK